LHERFHAEIQQGQVEIHGDDAKDLSFLDDSSVNLVFGIHVIYFLDPLPDYLTEFRRVMADWSSP